MPKEILPIIDKPLIQYAAEEAIAAGLDTLIFITGRNKRAIEDHFDGNNELELALRTKGKNEMADMVKNILPEGIAYPPYHMCNFWKIYGREEKISRVFIFGNNIQKRIGTCNKRFLDQTSVIVIEYPLSLMLVSVNFQN